jgi:hypothetical protein
VPGELRCVAAPRGEGAVDPALAREIAAALGAASA